MRDGRDEREEQEMQSLIYVVYNNTLVTSTDRFYSSKTALWTDLPALSTSSLPSSRSDSVIMRMWLLGGTRTLLT